MGATYKDGKVNVYRIWSPENELLFEGTAKEAVEKGFAKTQGLLRQKVYKIIKGTCTYDGMKAEIYKRDAIILRKKGIETEYTPCCIISDCPGFNEKLLFPPCCYYCKYKNICEDRCLNTPDKCSCFCEEGSIKFIEAYNEVMNNV